jgi:hypothetical protein
MIQVVEPLPNKHGALSSNTSTAKNNYVICKKIVGIAVHIKKNAPELRKTNITFFCLYVESRPKNI